MFFIDTNILLEGILEQEKSKQVYNFLKSKSSESLSISDFSIYSIGIILFRLKKHNLFTRFLNDLFKSGINILTIPGSDLYEVKNTSEKFNLDFDDAYQYFITKKFNLQIVSFDKDFDTTDIKRIEPV